VEIRLGHRLDRASWLMAFVLIALVLARQGLMVLELLTPGHDEGAGLIQRLSNVAVGGAGAEERSGSPYRVGRL
jgi:hypothetical protein